MLSLLQNSCPFFEWAVKIQSQNSILHNTPSHLTDDALKYHLEVRMHHNLALDYCSMDIAGEENLWGWVEKVRLLDDRWLREIVKQREAVDATLCAASHPSECCLVPGQTMGQKPFGSKENEGCFKCHRPFQKHTSCSCNNDFPDTKMYKMPTSNDIAMAKYRNSSNKIATVEVDIKQTMAVVMTSAVLGNSSDSGDECVASLLSSHLKWSCLVDGPVLTKPLTIEALIDHGSPVVFIDQTLINKLGLCICQLKQLLPVSVAMLNREKQEFSLLHFVKIFCTSPDLHYHFPLLLGGPFLEHNKIVIDHEVHTCIDKDQNYDLLNPSPPPSTLLLLAHSLPQLYDIKKAVVAELKDVLPEYKVIINKECELTAGVDVVIAVGLHIAALSAQEWEQQRTLALEDFKRHNDVVKAEFADWFPADIPHNDSLPSDVLFQIHIKDPDKIIQSCSYDCPKQYWDTWKTS
ncbi:hypothetical protein PAXRUDRAFT_36705 [Paxillus rubicundulus Ve08.2h10]|uniref:Uncharacterized protein n=1 Tax=Paxillus rubicundulus Ve08.2h10 TaxID=930991 RepID=A0A0D0CRR3_9AGAM|nr:hypothetical protein PAXRUDRAFT_36705 [Paxillus rubicundulus Ve08.2h10]